eukprot:9771225-Heterocapsa_arctica.AAC.2
MRKAARHTAQERLDTNVSINYEKQDKSKAFEAAGKALKERLAADVAQPTRKAIHEQKGDMKHGVEEI